MASTSAAQGFSMPGPAPTGPLVPSAATASMFLYAQGSAVICCHHDTLNIERQFSRHAEEVQLLAIDNQSEHGSGRLVVSYDAGQTAIVWDLMTGDELARFASYEPLTVATWMRNGNVAFGNAQGNVTLFEPATSEHLSTRTLDQIRVTALAPASDCRTFAIGYQNGSLLIATLQPRFTILHNLTTARGPSPIVTLAWHASASRQKSDMLASQTQDGDLRVWSVAKTYSPSDPAKVVRSLKRTENAMNGPHWMGWSKNGRIIQYTDGQTVSWDVRTKHVTYDHIPTLPVVRGIALYGPGASLFTLGDENSVQQFDLNTPSIIVANVTHPSHLPPSPPVSVEERDRATRATDSSDGTVPSIELHVTSSDEDRALDRNRDLLSSSERYDTSSPGSSHSGSSSLGNKGNAQSRRRAPTETSDITYISGVTSMRSNHRQHQQQQLQQGTATATLVPTGFLDRADLYSTSTRSMSSKSSAQRGRSSRLRHELGRQKPAELAGKDLFKFTRARLDDLSYRMPAQAHNTRLTNDDLRRQMLSTIFGWNGEVDDLIRDERSRHPQGSSCRMLLSKWLDEEDGEMLPNGSENMTSSDWMLLAISGMGSQTSQHKLGRAYVQRLLGEGDVHGATTIMLALGDQNDAIEIYVSHRKYMEALILTCHSFPAVWERQAAIIRKWGEYAVQHGQQQLAIRCAACTDKESSEPWASPSALQLNFRDCTRNVSHSIPEVMSPPLSPPSNILSPVRSVGKSSGLKLVTSFGGGNAKTKFFDDGQTPIAAGVTPIAESAISPGGIDPSTAFLRPSQNSRFNTPITARPSDRFPSIGESLLSREKQKFDLRDAARPAMPPSVSSVDQSFGRDESGLPSPDSDILVKMLETRASNTSAGRSRDRLPVPLKLQLQEREASEAASPNSNASRFHWPRRRGPGSVSSASVSNSVASGSVVNSAGFSAGLRSATSNATGKSVDDYIHSIDAARSSAKPRSRQESRGRCREASRDRGRDRGREKAKERDRDGDGDRDRERERDRNRSEDRGRSIDRTAAAINKSKQSPTSPIPMNLSIHDPMAAGAADAGAYSVKSATPGPKQSSSRASSRIRSDGWPNLRIDTRSRSRARSPSSPAPMSAHYQGSEDEDDYLKAVEDQENFRAKRGTSRARDSRSGYENAPMSAQPRHRSRSGGNNSLLLSLGPRAASTEHAGDLRKMKDERQRKKEAAARELEERRKSLAQRSRTPGLVVNPAMGATSESDVYDAGTGRDEYQQQHHRQQLQQQPDQAQPHSAQRSMYARNGPMIGLPATPKAMRLVINPQAKNTPGVPGIPASLVANQPAEDAQALPAAATTKEEEPPLLLPSTVYQPPSRSMSAPIPEPTLPRRTSPGQHSTPGGTPAPHGASRGPHGQTFRKASTDSARPEVPPLPLSRRPSYSEHRPSRDDSERPPPFVKELQHLASPPPPPPPPMPPYQTQKGSQSVIEVFHDDDDEDEDDSVSPAAVIERRGPSPQQLPPAAAEIVPHTVIPRPASSASKSHGHSRGRSLASVAGDSIASRLTKATTRLRSQSRTPGRELYHQQPQQQQQQQPQPQQQQQQFAVPRDMMQVSSPYESIPPYAAFSRDSRSPIAVTNPPFSTGLHRSEMI